jgi:hypothetical protein
VSEITDSQKAGTSGGRGVKALYVLTLIAIVLCVAIFCSTWAAIHFSHDAVKNRELDLQIELAKAIGQYSKQSFADRSACAGSVGNR